MKHWISNNLYALILGVLLIIVALSVSFTTRLANQFALEEKRKMELWAEATRQLIMADEDENIDLILSVMEGNTTIPVYMVLLAGSIFVGTPPASRSFVFVTKTSAF